MRHVGSVSDDIYSDGYISISFNQEWEQPKGRIYLDEYPEQEELRKNWFERNHDVFKHIYTRFLRRN